MALPPNAHAAFLAAIRASHLEEARAWLKRGLRIGNLVTGVLPTHALPLHAAAATGDVPMVELLLSHGTALELTSNTGETPLMSAAGAGKYTTVEYLLEHGANTMAVDARGRSALFYAIQSTDAGGGVYLLIRKGARVNEPDAAGILPLYLAVQTCDYGVAHHLIEAGADPNGTTEQQRNPPLIAAMQRSSTLINLSRLIETLIDAGVNVNTRNEGGVAALVLAAQSGKSNPIKYLINHGANEDEDLAFAALAEYGATPQTDLVEYSPTMDMCIIVAALAGRKSLDKFVNCMVYALRFPCKGTHMTDFITSKAIYKGRYTPERCLLSDDNGDTLLHYAARNGDEGVVRWLLKLEFSPLARNTQDETPIHWARTASNHAVMCILGRYVEENEMMVTEYDMMAYILATTSPLWVCKPAAGYTVKKRTRDMEVQTNPVASTDPVATGLAAAEPTAPSDDAQVDEPPAKRPRLSQPEIPAPTIQTDVPRDWDEDDRTPSPVALDLAGDLTALARDLEAAQHELAESRAREAALELERTRHWEAKAGMERKITGLKKELDTTRKLNGDYSRQISKLKGEVQRRTEEVEHARKMLVDTKRAVMAQMQKLPDH